MEVFGKTIFVMIMIVITTLTTGFVFFKIYNWHLVPIYGINEITFHSAICIMFLVNFLKVKYNVKDDDKTGLVEKSFVTTIAVLGTSAFELFFGWVLTLFQ